MSPVGPSSHVFLSNRAAALLSLKRYEAAATDARRAIALAPTFGKAYARLGQALYRLKDYKAAVDAYQDALDYEPDNEVTLMYLEKAQHKLEKYNASSPSSAISMADTAITPTHSVMTHDPNNTGVVTHGYRGTANHNVARAAVPSLDGPPPPPPPPPPSSAAQQEEDPDFEEALKIQQRANKFLAAKHYRAAVEEYTAALFLVPDDEFLSSDLHLGRAHALNGSRRHESAKNDAILAIRLHPTPQAYSTLAKSLFYLKDFRGSVEAFQKCTNMLPPGEELGMFDKAYLQKAEAALEEEEASLRKAGMRSTTNNKSSVPKLPPPRFVSREEAIQKTPNIPKMPQKWPHQMARETSLKLGPERRVVFLSEGLGIKLNRGPDGVVRVLSVAEDSPSSPVARNGDIRVGDVVREAGGVDIRRPITNIMWGDTVALIKMAPRPIALIVASEESVVPPAVVEELRKNAP